VSGIKTNVDLFRRILADPEFAKGEYHTRWLDEWLGKNPGEPTGESNSDQMARDAALIGSLAWHLGKNGLDAPRATPASDGNASRWKFEGRQEQVNRIPEK
jgi:acetyl/propionyl-CoA carboxylase alpha subunit